MRSRCCRSARHGRRRSARSPGLRSKIIDTFLSSLERTQTPWVRLESSGAASGTATGVALGWRRPRRGVALNHGKAAVWVISPRGLPAESWADSPLPEVVTDLAPCEWTPGTAPAEPSADGRDRCTSTQPSAGSSPTSGSGDAGAGQLAASGARGASLVTQRAEPAPRRKGLRFWRTRLAVSPS